MEWIDTDFICENLPYPCKSVSLLLSAGESHTEALAQFGKFSIQPRIDGQPLFATALPVQPFDLPRIVDPIEAFRRRQRGKFLKHRAQMALEEFQG